MGTRTFTVPRSVARMAVLAWEKIQEALRKPDEQFGLVGLAKDEGERWLHDHEGLISYINEKVQQTAPQDSSRGIDPGQTIPFDCQESPWPDVLAAAILAVNLHQSNAIRDLPVDPSHFRQYLERIDEEPAVLPFNARQLERLLGQ